MKTCCFCFDLKHGSNASATFTLVTRAIGIIAFSLLLWYVHLKNEEQINSGHSSPTVLAKNSQVYFTDVALGLSIAGCVLIVAFSIMLIIGVKKNIKGLFLPWIVMIGIELVGFAFLLVKSLIVIAYGGVVYVFLATLLLAAFHAYMLWCVIAYYKSVSAAATNQGYQNFSTPNNEMPTESPPPYEIEKDEVRVV